ncbi:unnamed protein product [Heligmosomoides polygyrus]|uniref:Uncharacterized protein n=1 Tax=Heligmosomoides polygyrus TaxID=6339 RepID=A0A3P7T9M9_HELPZ|nr:unnamed protein product [Heligmosomoides polygyrus]
MENFLTLLLDNLDDRQHCRGVTFTGVIVPHKGEPNCLLVGCRDRCEMNERAEYTDGLLSVLINRTEVGIRIGDLYSETSMPRTPSFAKANGSSTIINIVTGSLAPVWAVGLAIVIAVVCVGLNLGLLSAYICYRRQRSRKQTSQITVNKGPTLHAYNPTIGLR